MTLAQAWRFTANDVLLHALPIFHVHGLFVAINTVLASGCSMLFLSKFDADEVVRLLPEATVMMGVPTFYTRLLQHPGFTRDAAANIRLFVSGSAPLLAETHREFRERTGHAILERYGMSETLMNTSNPYDGERVAGSVGPALPGVEVRIADPESGVPLPEAGDGRHDRGARTERVRRLLAHAGEDRGGVPQGRFLHHGRRRPPRPAAATCSSSAAPRT